MAKRKESVWSLQETVAPGKWRTSDVEITFTRRGLWVNGHYDSGVGIGPTTLITWEECDRRRREVMGKRCEH